MSQWQYLREKYPKQDAIRDVAPCGSWQSPASFPLAGVVYDPKVSAFLRYIGQEQFVDLAELTGQNLCAMIDQCVAQAAHPEAQAAAVRNLQAMEQKNVEVARRLLKG